MITLSRFMNRNLPFFSITPTLEAGVVHGHFLSSGSTNGNSVSAISVPIPRPCSRAPRRSSGNGPSTRRCRAPSLGGWSKIWLLHNSLPYLITFATFSSSGEIPSRRTAGADRLISASVSAPAAALLDRRSPRAGPDEDHVRAESLDLLGHRASFKPATIDDIDHRHDSHHDAEDGETGAHLVGDDRRPCRRPRMANSTGNASRSGRGGSRWATRF